MIRASLAAVALLVACSLTRADPPTTRPVAEIAKPKLITLSVKDAPVKSVLDSLQKQSKYNPTLAAGQPELLDTKISIDLDKVPWIEALMRVCEAANLNPYNYADRWTISPRGNQRMLGPRHVNGPAMVAFTTVTTDTGITYDTTNRVSRQLQIAGSLAVEPTLEVDGVSSVIDVTIIDDLGRETTTQSRGTVSSSSYATLRRDFTISAALPDGQAKRIKSITGTIIAPALTARATLEVPDLLASQGKRLPIANGHVTVDAVRKRATQIYEVDLAFEKGTLPDGAFPRLRTNSSRIQPTQTKKDEPASLRVHRVNDAGGVTKLTIYVQLLRAANDDAARVVDLRWDIPTQYTDVAIPFRIEDIPLP